VFQSIVADLKTEKIDAIKYKNDINNMTTNEIFDISDKFGYTLLSLDGYTSTEDYLRKEVKSLIPRIQWKNTRTAYKWLFYIFNLIGDIYPIRTIGLDPTFRVVDDYWTNESINITQTFTLDPDPADTLDSTTGLWISILDQTTSAVTILRHLLISYAPRFIENTTEFISLNTLKVFLSDVKQTKRATEIPYFEHQLIVPAYLNKTLYTKTYTTYDESSSANMYSILTGSNLTNFNFMEFGNGARSSFASGTISGVVSLVKTLRTTPSGEIQFIESLSANQLYGRRIITDKNIFPSFTEIALKDANSGCLLYSTFPKVQWDEKMFSSILFKINLV